jgi:transcriptional regulator with XRE-family HTH domain
MTNLNVIRNIRLAFGLSPSELALKSGCCPATIYNTEHGISPQVPKKIMEFVVQRGFDRLEIESAYQKFRTVKDLEIDC